MITIIGPAMRCWVAAAIISLAVWSGAHWPLLLMAPLLATRWRRPALLLGLLYLAGLLALHQGLAARLPESLNGVTLTVTGRVVSLPEVETAWRYGQLQQHQKLVASVRLAGADARWPGEHRVRLSAWGEMTVLHAGDQFRGQVRLYFPHGLYNQSGPDWARIGLSHHIDGHGSLRRIGQRRGHPYSLAAWRQYLAARLHRLLAGSPLGQAVIPALVVSDLRGLDESLWTLFRDCGTVHLLSISGLHLTLVAGLFWWAGRWMVALLRTLGGWRGRATDQQWAWLFALAASAVYAALAGFNLPVSRALLMVAVLALCGWTRRRADLGRSLGVALVVVLLCDPLAALSASLWLSFTAVAMIALVGENRGWPLSLTLPPGMAVMGCWLFHTWAWWSPLANLLLVPLYSFLVVPLGLLGAFSGWQIPLTAAATGVEASVAAMQWIEGLPVPPLGAPFGLAGPLLLAAVLLAVMPGRPWPRPLLWLWLLPWLWPASSAPGVGRVDMIVFEVGQGQAVALRTAHHLVLYDLGPRWPGGNAASQTLIPWLKRFRLTPDLTIVSHGDDDHAGGLPALAEPGRLLSGEPDRVPGSAPCRAGQHWRFDGVDFSILWPHHNDGLTGNSASCVLRVQAGAQSALLTGDIPRQVEYRLLGSVAPVTVLLLSHHGSNSASSAAWLRALRPRWAVASAGYANPFGHPHPAVLARLRQAGVRVLQTARSGMIVFRLGGPDNAALVTRWRRAHPRPWQTVESRDADGKLQLPGGTASD